MKRRHGQGSITETADGRFWVRGPRQPNGSRPSFGYATSREQAEVILEHGILALRTCQRQGCSTFVDFGRKLLDDRELEGRKAAKHDRDRFDKHLATAPFAGKPLDEITTSDGAEWLRIMARKDADDRRGKRKISKLTVQRALSLANVIFQAAGPQGAGLIDRNPFLELEARGRVDDPDTKWTFLELEEQMSVMTAQPTGPRAMTEAERLCILFGAGSGMRQGEQFGLRMPDLRDLGTANPYAKLWDTKNGTSHEVPLFGIALDALTRWLDLRKKLGIKSPFVWPSLQGKRRRVGKPLGNGAFLPSENGTHIMVSGKPKRVASGGTHRYRDRLKEVLAQCGITRNVRWHDMRHTCASSMIRGDWSDDGQAFTQKEVQEMLNHSSAAMTDRYAHLGETALKKAAREKVGMGCRLVGLNGGAASSIASISNDSAGEPPSRIELETYGLRNRSVVEALRALAEKKTPHNPLVTHLVDTLEALLA